MYDGTDNKSIDVVKSTEPVDTSSDDHTYIEDDTGKPTAEDKGRKEIPSQKETKPPISPPSQEAPTPILSNTLLAPKSQSLQGFHPVSLFTDVTT